APEPSARVRAARSRGTQWALHTSRTGAGRAPSSERPDIARSERTTRVPLQRTRQRRAGQKQAPTAWSGLEARDTRPSLRRAAPGRYRSPLRLSIRSKVELRAWENRLS